jgi:hypothetical protein
VRVKLGAEVDEVVMSGAAATVRQQGAETVVIPAGTIPALAPANP